MDALTLRCPHCGAAADPGKPRCAYCEARLATVSCPSCLALMFDEATFCTACGARWARTERPSEVKCPACRAVMGDVAVGDVHLLECSRCDAVWMDVTAFERICADQESQAAVIHHRPTAPPAGGGRVGYRPCVRCGTMMNRVNFARLSGTVIDVCKGHGTFLDRGELQAIVRFIQGGGLERARRRQLEELKEQERRLREQAARLRSSSYGSSGGGNYDFDALIDFSGDD